MTISSLAEGGSTLLDGAQIEFQNVIEGVLNDLLVADLSIDLPDHVNDEV